MKFYGITILFLICTITQYAAADWKEDFKKKRLNSMDDFVIKQLQILQSNAMIHNGGWYCVTSATTQLTGVMSMYRPKIAQCVSAAANEEDAKSCCDVVDYDTIARISVISNQAFSCIMNS